MAITHCEACGEQTDGDAVMIGDTVFCEECAVSTECCNCGQTLYLNEEVAWADENDPAVLLIGGDALCTDCYDKAVEARSKIVIVEVEEDGVEGYYEDVSALTDEERRMARILDAADEARNQADREMISSYPRRERRQLHRYQDDIKVERFREGKAT